MDIASVMIACLALAVSSYLGYRANVISNEAKEISYKAWTRPAPADPTYIPTFGQNGKPATIDAGQGGRDFFAFLDKNPSRKIRIIARVVEDQEKKLEVRPTKDLNSTFFHIRRGCPPGQECFTEIDALVIRGTGPDKPGIVNSSGNWVFEGYFANYGLVAEKQSTSERMVVAMDIVTAVS